MRDLVNNISSVPTIGANSLSADANGSGVDLKGFQSATVLIAVGVGGITFSGTNKIEFQLQHSDDNSTFSAVGSGDVILGQNADASVGAGGIVRSLVAAHGTPSVAEVGYIGGKRYIRAVADFSGTHGSGTPMSVTVVRGHPMNRPA